MVRFFVSLLLLLTLDAYAKSAGEYWKKTPLNFAALREVVNTETCYRDSEKFLGCVNAINGLLRFSKTPSTFLPLGARNPENVERVLKSYGSLQLVQLRLPPKDEIPDDIIAAFEKAKVDRKQSLLEWNNLFKSTHGPRKQIPFTDLLRELEKDARALPEFNEPEMTAAALNQYLATVFDPHTYIQPTQQIQDAFSGNANENFFGIGARLRSLKGGISAEPMEGSPALKAGLRNKDIVTHVDGVSVAGKELDEVVQQIRGTQNTSVQLTVQRKGESLTITIVRGPIETQNVQSKLLQNPRGNWGYVKLNNFMEKAGCKQVAQGIRELEAQGSQGLILDLRSNVGGLLDQAVCISGLFLEAGTPVVEQRPLSKFQRPLMLKTEKPIQTRAPLVVLINGGSASASEIVSGALQDHARAVIVGERSFGKGSVQGIEELPNMREVSMAKTMARFYQPSGRTNQIVGIAPDLEVFVSPNPTANERFAYREEDLYTNALPPAGPRWTQPRPEYVEQLNRCRDSQGTAAAEFEARQDDALPADYVLLVAQDTLGCMTPTR